MNRKLAREMAMKLLFQMDLQDDFSSERIYKYLEELPQDHQSTYIENIGKNFLEHKAMIDSKLEEHSKEWKIDRMAKVDLSILRLAITEILYVNDIPQIVSINEAVELAKTFSTQASSKFINGVLGGVIQSK